MIDEPMTRRDKILFYALLCLAAVNMAVEVAILHGLIWGF